MRSFFMSQQPGGGGAAATNAATVDQSSPSTSRWHSTMQKIATKVELLQYRRIRAKVSLTPLLLYNHWSGRYQQVDTARKMELNTTS